MPAGDAAMGRRDGDSLRLEEQVALHPGQQLLFGRSQTAGEQLPTSEPKYFFSLSVRTLCPPNLWSSSFPLTYIRTTKVFYGHTIFTI